MEVIITEESGLKTATAVTSNGWTELLGGSQLLVPANASRIMLRIFNPDAFFGGVVYGGLGTDAVQGQGFVIVPGDYFSIPEDTGGIFTGAVYLNPTLTPMSVTYVEL